MADKKLEQLEAEAKPTLIGYAKAWGTSSGPPAVLATLIAAQHLQPPRLLPLSFSPVLLFSSYLNLSGYTTDAAGLTAAWSGLYLLLARRRKHTLGQKWSIRGGVRGATLATCAVNLLAGGWTYATGQRDSDA